MPSENLNCIASAKPIKATEESYHEKNVFEVAQLHINNITEVGSPFSKPDCTPEIGRNHILTHYLITFLLIFMQELIILLSLI